LKQISRFLCLIILVFTVSCQQADSPHLPQPPSPIPSPEIEPIELDPEGSAKKYAIPYADMARLGVGRLPAWPSSLEHLNQFVQEGRNARIYPNPNPGDYLRRAPWYYGDGCYAKAAHMAALAEKNGYPSPGKVFAFGGWATMRFKSKYLPGGAAWWNFHVVAAYHIDSQVYVLDPLVSPERALTVDEWIRTIAPNPAKISVSFCDQNIYSEDERCIGGHNNGAYTGQIRGMLREEYRRLKSMGYDPDTLL
jgi:hypothetical protein